MSARADDYLSIEVRTAISHDDGDVQVLLVVPNDGAVLLPPPAARALAWMLLRQATLLDGLNVSHDTIQAEITALERIDPLMTTPDADRTYWYDDYRNTAALAEAMHAAGYDIGDIRYMLSKPWKYDEEYSRMREGLPLNDEIPE